MRKELRVTMNEKGVTVITGNKCSHIRCCEDKKELRKSNLSTLEVLERLLKSEL